MSSHEVPHGIEVLALEYAIQAYRQEPGEGALERLERACRSFLFVAGHHVDPTADDDDGLGGSADDPDTVRAKRFADDLAAGRFGDDDRDDEQEVTA